MLAISWIRRRGGLGGGQLDEESGAATGFALAPDASPHVFDELFDDGETETGGDFAAGGAGAQAGVALEEARLFVGADAGAFVADAEADAVGGGAGGGDADGGVDGRVFDRVGKEIVADLAEGSAVGLDGKAGLGFGVVEGDGLSFGDGLEGGEGFAQGVGEFDAFCVQAAGAGLEGFDIEKVADHVQHLVHEEDHAIEALAAGVGVVHTHEVNAYEKAGEGVAQIVGGHAHEAAFFAVEAFEPGVGFFEFALEAEALIEFALEAVVVPAGGGDEQAGHDAGGDKPADGGLPADDGARIEASVGGDEVAAFGGGEGGDGVVEDGGEFGLVAADGEAEGESVGGNAGDLEVGEAVLADEVGGVDEEIEGGVHLAGGDGVEAARHGFVFDEDEFGQVAFEGLVWRVFAHDTDAAADEDGEVVEAGFVVPGDDDEGKGDVGAGEAKERGAFGGLGRAREDGDLAREGGLVGGGPVGMVNGFKAKAGPAGEEFEKIGVEADEGACFVSVGKGSPGRVVGNADDGVFSDPRALGWVGLPGRGGLRCGGDGGEGQEDYRAERQQCAKFAGKGDKTRHNPFVQ